MKDDNSSSSTNNAQSCSVPSYAKATASSQNKKATHQRGKNKSQPQQTKQTQLSCGSSSNNEQIEQSLKRMVDHQKKHKEKMERLITKYQREEDLKHKKFQINTSLYTYTTNDGFFERLEKKQKQIDSKIKKMKEDKQRKENEEIIKLQKQTIKKSNELIQQSVNKMYKWEEDRKGKILEKEKLIKEKEHNELKLCFKPQILKKSAKIAKKCFNNSTDNAFERLYKDNINRKEKNKLMQTLYIPEFKPTLNKKDNDDENAYGTHLNMYEDYSTNTEVENMLRSRVVKKQRKGSSSVLLSN